MTKLEAVTAKQLTSPDQYEAMDDAIHDGSTSESGGILYYSAHAHMGTTLDPVTSARTWNMDVGSPDTLYYPYEAGSPIPGSVAIQSDVLSYTKVWPNFNAALDITTGFGVRPDFAKTTTLYNGLLYAVLPAAHRNNEYFTGAVVQFPNTTKQGLNTAVFACFKNVTDAFSFKSKISLHKTATTAKAIRTHTYSVYNAITGDAEVLIATLVLPAAPVICKVSVWRTNDDNANDILLSHFKFKVPFGVF